ncbi:MAG: hypothetical protein A2Z97_00465 [Bdellovibrionales bacterium GWB1_52_6]|nr:MAG: hypothetical protein A2Z97_00465 [Bdellovibrionales bacterium GWB1_52_6]OFZ03241.1 MAG: hypothetical protein A2X97_09955 [Bdellovibrionales bacterium GWA1_52_35]HCM40577.1 hypothetical protein [Bdellovibrionales bacterium]
MRGCCGGIHKLKFLWLAAVFLLSGPILACAKKHDDSAKLAAAIMNLRSGAVVQAVENAAAEESNSAIKTGPEHLMSGPVADPCFQIPVLEGSEIPALSEEDAQRMLLALNTCVRGLFAPSKRIATEFIHYQLFVKDRGRTELRNRFSDSELEDLQDLAAARRLALIQAEAQTLAAFESRRKLLERFAVEVDRYTVLLAYMDSVRNPSDSEFFESLSRTLKFTSIRFPRDIPEFPKHLLRPYALEALIAEPGRDFESLRGTQENPFSRTQAAEQSLAGMPEQVTERLAAYRKWRDQDNPALPLFTPAHERAARVAFIDSGLDFIKFPELGIFLGHSHDFADDDENPWLPAIRPDFAHGSGTIATLLTVVSAQNPEILADRKIEVSVWKTLSLRQLLAGAASVATPSFGWDNRKAESAAIVTQGESDLLSETGASRIISVSESFRLAPHLKHLPQHFIRSLPWLWVMAAGNAGVDLDNAAIPSCLNDLSEEGRDDRKIICVGALVRDGGKTKIAGYSNFGERVDVYAFDSYTGLCPSGTSCSTPAVTAAVAVLAAKFPDLSPEQLKASIIAAADLRELEVDLLHQHGPAPLRAIRVFDPLTSLVHAIDHAQKLLPVQKTGKRDQRE